MSPNKFCQYLLRTALIACFFTIACSPCSAKKGPVIKIDKKSYDLGILYHDSDVLKKAFYIRVFNTGDSKLVITEIKTGCHCTTAELPVSFIAPGKSANIKVTFDGSASPPQLKRGEVLIYSNTADKAVQRIQFKVDIR